MFDRATSATCTLQKLNGHIDHHSINNQSNTIAQEVIEQHSMKSSRALPKVAANQLSIVAFPNKGILPNLTPNVGPVFLSSSDTVIPFIVSHARSSIHRNRNKD